MNRQRFIHGMFKTQADASQRERVKPSLRIELMLQKEMAARSMAGHEIHAAELGGHMLYGHAFMPLTCIAVPDRHTGFPFRHAWSKKISTLKLLWTVSLLLWCLAQYIRGAGRGSVIFFSGKMAWVEFFVMSD